MIMPPFRPLLFVAAILSSVLGIGAGAQAADASPQRTQVRIETSLGAIDVLLYDDLAPETVRNFLVYVNEKYYDGLIFHRVVSGFVVQGGSFASDYKERPTHAVIKNESANGQSNLRGSISMARCAPKPDSAQAQFFINLADNIALDRIDDRPLNAGYCVFGKVVAGLDVADKIGATEKVNGRLYSQTGAEIDTAEIPKDPVVIKSIRVLAIPKTQ